MFPVSLDHETVVHPSDESVVKAPIDQVASATGSDAAPSVKITGGDGDLAQAAMASMASAAPSDSAGQAELYKIEMGGAGRSDHYAASSTKPGESSPKKISWNLPEPKEWVVIGLIIKVAGGS